MFKHDYRHNHTRINPAPKKHQKPKDSNNMSQSTDEENYQTSYTPKIELPKHKSIGAHNVLITAIRGYFSNGNHTLVLLNNRYSIQTQWTTEHVYNELCSIASEYPYLIEANVRDIKNNVSKSFINAYDIDKFYISDKYSHPVCKVEFTKKSYRPIWIDESAESFLSRLNDAKLNHQLKVLLADKTDATACLQANAPQ